MSNRLNKTLVLAVITIVSLFVLSLPAATKEGASIISKRGYDGCVKLWNATTEVILEPNFGGRVIEYNLNGTNVLYADSTQNGMVYSPQMRRVEPCGGRFDIGPENGIPSHPSLWYGTWEAEITGARSARLISQPDSATGVQIVREFTLAMDSSHLRCTQIVRNISATTRQYFHWGRTFVQGNGICLVPLSGDSRYPLGYCMFGPGAVLNYRPQANTNVTVRDNFFEITGAPPQPKYAIDSNAGWLAYITRSNVCLVKIFPVYPNRPYGEIAANTISIWYNRDVQCEIEPIGPRETLRPGKSFSFTEEWWLLPYQFPNEGDKVDLAAFSTFVKEKTR